MDLLEELELIIAGIDWEEVVENTPNPPSPPLEFNTNSEPTQSGDPGRQAGAHSQGQCDNVPVLKPSVPTASPSNADEADPCSHDVSDIKNEYERQPDDGRLYIKKPPNAFMLFRKEQAPSVNAELDITGAAANTVLGKRWKNLLKEEQAKYYEQAKQEKQLHTQHFPEWSCKNNYGKKMKRDRRKVCTMAEASVSGPEEATEQVMNVRLRPLRAAVRKLSAALKPHTHTAENPLTHTGLVEAPHEDIPATVHVLGSDDPPQTSEHLPLCAASCEQLPHPASMEDEETLLTEKLAHKVPTLHTFSISPLYFYYMD